MISIKKRLKRYRRKIKKSWKKIKFCIKGGLIIIGKILLGSFYFSLFVLMIMFFWIRLAILAIVALYASINLFKRGIKK